MMDDVAFLEELVTIPSVSGQEDRLIGYLCERMTSLGFRTRRDAVGNLLGEVGDSDAENVVVLPGHMDTVPVSWPKTLSASPLSHDEDESGSDELFLVGKPGDGLT